jgi:hypothetical protein
VFCNLAVSLTVSRSPECFHKADEETLARFGQHWFSNIGGELANNPISHPVSPFSEEARYSCLIGGRLEGNLDFSLRRVTFR